MKKHLRNFGILAILTTGLNIAHSQAAHTSKRHEVEIKAKIELEAINSRIEYFYTKEKPDSMTGLYDREFIYLPEYKPAINDVDHLHKFYTDWFKTVDIKAYKKQIYEVQAITGYLLETGHFSFKYAYTTKFSAENEFSGKYMIMWKRNAAGKLRILSEAFGSDKNIDRKNMPYAAVLVKENKMLDENKLSKQLQPEIEEFNRGVVKAVLDGDGAARASEFTEDGIYMPHFDQMQVGMEAIKPYMQKTYRPGVFSYVTDTYHEIFDTGDFVFLNGAFKVGWDNAKGKGGFTGNMSNLMKRGKNGKLLMYRQLAHND